MDYCADKPELEDIARAARFSCVGSLLEVSLGKYPLADIRRAAAHGLGTNDRAADARILVYGAATLSHEDRFTEGNLAMQAVLDVYPDQSLSVGNAHLFIGINYHYTRRPQQAIHHYRSSILIPLDKHNIEAYRGRLSTSQQKAAERLGWAMGTEALSDPQIADALSALQREIELKSVELHDRSTSKSGLDSHQEGR